MQFELMVSDRCKKLKPYKAGLTSESIQQKFGLTDVYKFASNESPFSPSPNVCDAINKALNDSNRYPDYEELKQRISREFELEASSVMLGTGSINVLEVLFQTFNRPDNNVVFSSHSYFAYPLLSQKAGLSVRTAAMGSEFEHIAENLLALCDDNTSILVIDNPTNFAGSAISAEKIDWILEQVSKNTIVILDQAYAEFADQHFIDINKELFEKHKNLVITRTFSKVHSLASLRVGYGFAHPQLVDWFNRSQQPFPISNLGIAAATASLEDRQYYKNTMQLVKQGRSYLSQELEQLGVKVYTSEANFVLAYFADKASSLYEDLLANGFITRQMTVYGEPDYIRISIGNEDENKRLITAIKERI